MVREGLLLVRGVRGRLGGKVMMVLGLWVRLVVMKSRRLGGWTGIRVGRGLEMSVVQLLMLLVR